MTQKTDSATRNPFDHEKISDCIKAGIMGMNPFSGSP
jgi:hypothetical protein